jgi:hypothetical protein
MYKYLILLVLFVGLFFCTGCIPEDTTNMTSVETVKEYVANFYLFDLKVFTTPWVWFTILPILFYIPMFAIKWVFLTLPIWIPIVMVINSLKINF